MLFFFELLSVNEHLKVGRSGQAEMLLCDCRNREGIFVASYLRCLPCLMVTDVAQDILLLPMTVQVCTRLRLLKRDREVASGEVR